MPLTTSDHVSLRVVCQHCDQATAMFLSWLVVHDNMRCSHCSGVIDLQTGNNRLRIQELAEKCAAIDSKLDSRLA